jgi:hypothetical protein
MTNPSHRNPSAGALLRHLRLLSPGNDMSPCCGNKARRWPDWNERMWYLVNLFRVLNNDLRLTTAPEGSGLTDPKFDVYSPGVRERLAI